MGWKTLYDQTRIPYYFVTQLDRVAMDPDPAIYDGERKLGKQTLVSREIESMAARDDAWTVMICRPRYFPRVATRPPPAWAEPALRIRRLTVCNPAVNGEKRPSIRRALSANGQFLDIESSLVRVGSGIARWSFPLSSIPKKAIHRNQR
jgi:hypothetical protein